MLKRIEWLDFFKGILILTVILGHAIQSVYIERGEDFLHNYIWRLIYSFHMPAFIAISGFISYRPNYYLQQLSSITIRRFRQLIIPFIIWSGIMFVVNHNVDHYYQYFIYPNKSFWFLWALFFICFIFNLVTYTSQYLNISTELLIFLVTIVLMGIRSIMPDSKILGFDYIAYYLFYYALAHFLNKYQRFLPQSPKLLLCLGLIWLFLGSFYDPIHAPILLKWAPFIPDSMLNILYRVLTATIFIFLMFGIGVKFNTNDFLPNERYFVEFGKLSLGIYVVHMVIRGWIVKILNTLMPMCSDMILILLTFFLLSVVSFAIVRALGYFNVTAKWLLGKL